MSWFARSLVNTLRGEDDDEDDDSRGASAAAASTSPSEAADGNGWEGEEDMGDEPGTPTRGVKEDLSELTKTLTSRFWGVASFLAPPPAAMERDDDSSSPEASGRGRRSEGLDAASGEPNDAEEVATSVESPRLARIRSDFEEISGKVRSGISMLSQARAVAEISKFASSLLPFGLEDEEREDDDQGVEVERIELHAVGVSEDVVVFARNIAMHPETWLGFPLLNEGGGSVEFEMSDEQQKHAIAIVHLAPELADLRMELCPGHMSESNFWKVYFVLLHSRLSKQDAELLSTSQILEARTMLLQDLQIPKRSVSQSSEREGMHMKEDEIAVSNAGNPTSPPDLLHKSAQSVTSSPLTHDPVPVEDVDTEKHAVQTNAVEVVDKSVIEELTSHDKTKALPHETNRVPIQQHEEDGDDWLDDDTGEDGDNTRIIGLPLGPEEDVSFSDLEDDDADADIKANATSPYRHPT